MEVLLLVVKCFPVTSFIILSAQCSKQKSNTLNHSIEQSEDASMEVKKNTKIENVPPKTKTLSSESKSWSQKRLQKSPVILRKGNTTSSETHREKKNGSDRGKNGISPEKRDEGGKNDPEVDAVDGKKDKIEPDKEVQLDDTNEHIAYILEATKIKGDPEKTREFCQHMKMLNDQIGCFQWAMKKRFGFDETSWKHMSRRIALLKAEGFKVRVNTRKARENKKDCETHETRLDVILNKKRESRKKKPKKNKD